MRCWGSEEGSSHPLLIVLPARGAWRLLARRRESLGPRLRGVDGSSPIRREPAAHAACCPASCRIDAAAPPCPYARGHVNIGRASWWEGVCVYFQSSVVSVSSK